MKKNWLLFTPPLLSVMHRKMHRNQTLYYVLEQKARYSNFDSLFKKHLSYCKDLLIHRIQTRNLVTIFTISTAEKCRELMPDVDWFHIEYEDIKNYYDKLIAKYLPKKLKFFRPA